MTPASAQAKEVARHARLRDEEVERRVADGSWPWVPDGLEAYRRLLEFRGSAPGAGRSGRQ